MKKFLVILFLTIIVITAVVLLIIYLNKSKEKLTFNQNHFGENDFYVEIEDALSPEECDLIINNSRDKLIHSKVMSNDKNNNGKEDKNSRTSYQTWLENRKYKNIINKVTKLVNKFKKNYTIIDPNQYEETQVVRYKPTQEYKQHYDICHPIQGNKEHFSACLEDYKKNKSVRYATVIFYLNDGYEGGETYFPRLNKKIIPKKGKALIFFNCNFNEDTKKSGLCDVIYNSEHAGLPIIESNKSNAINEKWIATVWVRAKKRI